MTTVYENYWAIQKSDMLLPRFTIAVQMCAANWFTEPANTPNHANRLAWAKRVIFDTDKAQPCAYKILRVAVCLNATLQNAGENITDAQIQTIVNNYAEALANEGL